MIAKYVADGKVKHLIHYLESVKDYDRYYIALSLKMDYRAFNIKYYNNSFTEEEKKAIYNFVNENFYNNSLKIN